MASQSPKPTPLGVARARFVDGLPRKVAELKASISLLATSPSDERPREELRRRLHALYASAQVFQLATLTELLRSSIERLDLSRETKDPVAPDTITSLVELADALPELGRHEPTPAVSEDAETTAGNWRSPLPKRPSGLSRAVEDPNGTGRYSARPRSETPFAVPSAKTLVLRDSRTDIPIREERVETPATGSSEMDREPAVEMSLESALAPRQPSNRPTSRTLLMSAVREETASSTSTPPRPSFKPRMGTLQGIGLFPDDDSLPSVPAVAHVGSLSSVLVIDSPEWQARVRAMLPRERFEVCGSPDPEEALRLARSSSPDVVLADFEVLLNGDTDLARRLRDDPLTDFVPVIATVPVGVTVDSKSLRLRGADEVMIKPFDPVDLESTLAQLTGTLEARSAAMGLSGEHTLDEVAARIADEVRRGLVQAADRGRDIPVPLGDGSEVLAATWSAIARVRAHLAQRSGGQIHFNDSRATGRPALLALVDEEGSESHSIPVSLRDRQIIVADDDPAVVWFFAGLLREEQAVVREAADGAEALELARRRRPDVVISDILMPSIDGFGLTRELKRDPALSDIPVILISWKEDFLQRMRELRSGASGYLRKEAGAGQILECVRDVLRPRARLEAQLRARGEVRGRLERIGILPLLKTVAQQRSSARITIRDAWNLFEMDVRDGNLVDLTRTASDGSFSRGRKALTPLLGATVGRFAVADPHGSVRPSIREPMDVVLQAAAKNIGALVDAVSGKGLMHAHRLELDDDVCASLLRASPDPMRSVVEKVRSGMGPRELILKGEVAPRELESVLLDLARQGAILAVWGENDEDRVALAREARTDLELPHREPSVVPAEPDPRRRRRSSRPGEASSSAEISSDSERPRRVTASFPKPMLELDVPGHDPGPRQSFPELERVESPRIHDTPVDGGQFASSPADVAVLDPAEESAIAAATISHPDGLPRLELVIGDEGPGHSQEAETERSMLEAPRLASPATNADFEAAETIGSTSEDGLPPLVEAGGDEPQLSVLPLTEKSSRELMGMAELESFRDELARDSAEGSADVDSPARSAERLRASASDPIASRSNEPIASQSSELIASQSSESAADAKGAKEPRPSARDRRSSPPEVSDLRGRRRSALASTEIDARVDSMLAGGTGESGRAKIDPALEPAKKIPTPEEEAEGGWRNLAVFFLIALAVVIGFVIWRSRNRETALPVTTPSGEVTSQDSEARSIGGSDLQAEDSAGSEPAAGPDLRASEGESAPGEGESAQLEQTSPDEPSRAELALAGSEAAESSEAADPDDALRSFGREEDGIVPEYGVNVPPGQGLVVLEAPAAGVAQVRLGDREFQLSRASQALAFPEGIHEVAFSRGDSTILRFVRVQAGRTRFIPVPR